jgi:acetoin utilization protein AcuB
MLVQDYMTTEVTSLQDSDTLLDAAMVFVRSSFRHLPVVQGKKVVGIVTERDVKQFAPSLLSGTTAEEYNAIMETTPISRVMTKNPVTLRPDQPIFEAAKFMHQRRVGCMPVVENGELVGIVTTTDLLALLMKLMEARGLGKANPSAS